MPVLNMHYRYNDNWTPGPIESCFCFHPRSPTQYDCASDTLLLITRHFIATKSLHRAGGTKSCKREERLAPASFRALVSFALYVSCATPFTEVRSS